MSVGDAALSISWRRAAKTRPILIGCAALLVVAFVASLAVGPVVIAPGKVLSILYDAMFHGRPTAGIDMRDAVVVLDIRLPRAVLAAIVGAALAVAGALMQGIFRNPLADPGLVGVRPVPHLLPSHGSCSAARSQDIFRIFFSVTRCRLHRLQAASSQFFCFTALPPMKGALLLRIFCSPVLRSARWRAR